MDDVAVGAVAGEVEEPVFAVVGHVAAVHAVGVEPPVVQIAFAQGAVGSQRGLVDGGEGGVEVDEVESAALLVLQGVVKHYAVVYHHGTCFAAGGVDGVVEMGYLVVALSLDNS